MRNIVVIAAAVTAIIATLAAATPLFVDWRLKGVVGPVPNQGQCGDDAVFASIGNIAAVSAIANGMKFVPLSYSEVQICGRLGCNGQSIRSVYYWFLNHTGGRVAPASAAITNATCASLGRLPVGARIIAPIALPPRNEAALRRALATTGPVMVGVDADRFCTYSSGIFRGCGASGVVNHAVLLVGYNMSSRNASEHYYIIRNSWGSSWGEGGYIRLGMHQPSATGGACGIASTPITVRVSKL